MPEKPFDREVSWADSTDAKTSYKKAKQVWDERIGQTVVQARNWRFVAVISIALALGLLVALIYSMSQAKNHVFVAEVSKVGRVMNVVKIATPYKPTQAQEIYFIGQFVRFMRSIPLDPVVARKNWVNAYNFLTSKSAKNFEKSIQPNLLGKQTVSVEVVSINALSSESFNAQWRETTVGKDGKDLGTKTYSGVFTIAIIPPKTEAQILHNPLGIYIEEFSFREQAEK